MVALAVILLPGCKILPNNIRSGTTNTEATAMLDKDTIQFVRAADAKTGSLSFNLKDQHNCRVEYWADDPSGTPPPATPLSLDCAQQGLNLSQKLTIPGITPGFPLSFRIYIWPKTTTFLAHFATDFHEAQDLVAKEAQNMVVVRYAAPRNSAEIYTYRMPTTISLKDIKSRLSESPTQVCVENPPAPSIPYARSTSLEDAQKRPLQGLSTVTTSGFGSGAATQHPFFPTRLIEFYESTERQENWTWNFQWETKPFSFQSFPPGYIGSLTISDGIANRPVSNRNLSGAMDTVDLNANVLQLSPRVLFPTDASRFELTIKSADASDTLLRCRFAVDKDKLEVPSQFLNKLAQGHYLVTFSYETNQVHYKDQSAYPPWIITAQDWVQFRLNKRM